MARANLDGVPDAQDFKPMPPGKYMMEVEDIEETTSQKGDTMWKVCLKMVGGEYAGLHVWDNLTWSVKAFQRVRNFLVAIDALQTGDAEYDPQRFVSKRVMVDVIIEEYEGKKRNKVTFAGYSPAEARPANWQAPPVEAVDDGDPGPTPPPDVDPADVPF